MDEKRKKGRIFRLKRYLRIITAMDVVLIALCAILLVRGGIVENQYLSEKEIADSLSADLIASRENEQLLQQKVNEVSSSASGNDHLTNVRALAESGGSALDILKYLFPDQMVVAFRGAYHFFDIDTTLKQNTYIASGYSISDNGELTYADSAGISSAKGIDISQHNGDVDWEKVKASGVTFAFIRAGIRGYGSGKLVEDEKFDDNVTAAKAAGLKVGVYFFSQAVNEDEAKEEAAFVLDLIKDKGIDYPVAVDIEDVQDSSVTVRTADVSQAQHTANATAFCEAVKAAGYEPMIYGNSQTFMMLLDMTKLEDYDKWFADYITDADHTPYFPYAFSIWQYKCKGSCDGVDGTCDMNIAYN